MRRRCYGRAFGNGDTCKNCRARDQGRGLNKTIMFAVFPIDSTQCHRVSQAQPSGKALPSRTGNPSLGRGRCSPKTQQLIMTMTRSQQGPCDKTAAKNNNENPIGHPLTFVSACGNKVRDLTTSGRLRSTRALCARCCRSTDRSVCYRWLRIHAKPDSTPLIPLPGEFQGNDASLSQRWVEGDPCPCTGAPRAPGVHQPLRPGSHLSR